MQTITATRMRLGAMALGISAALFAVFPFVRPFFPTPDLSSPESLGVATHAMTSPNWVIAHIIAIMAMILLLLGMLALYVHLTNAGSIRRTFSALILSLLGIAFVLPTLGVETYTLPVIGKLYLEGQTQVVSAVGLMYAGPNSLFLMLGLFLLAIGAITFAISIWQSGSLPKWAGVSFAIGLALWFPLFPQMIRTIDGLLIGIGGIGIALSIWQKT